MTKRAKTTPGTTPGSFAPDKRADVSADIELPNGPVLTDPFTMSREELLDDPDVRFAPKEWIADKTVRELVNMIAEMRISRLRAAADAAEAEEDRQAEISRRRAYRRPDWLKMENVRGQRRYTTPDGYDGRDLVSYPDGRAHLVYRVNAPTASGPRDEAEFERVEQMVEWIEEHRAERAKTWTEKFPMTSPASRVNAFRGKPVETWLGSHPDGEASFIAADGSYVSVEPDNEDTGHWFIDGSWADGTSFEGACIDDRSWAMQSAEETLRAGQTAYELEQERGR